MSSCVCKISFKSVQVCGGCRKMFRGSLFWVTVYMWIANCSLLLYYTDYIIYLYMHCNFICGPSDVIIKTFSQSVSQRQVSERLRDWPIRSFGGRRYFSGVRRQIKAPSAVAKLGFSVPGGRNPSIFWTGYTEPWSKVLYYGVTMRKQVGNESSKSLLR